MFTDQQFMMWSGQAMLGLLIVILLARPLQKWFRFKLLMKYRRQLGWLLGGVSSAHLLYWVVYYYSFKVLMTSLASLWFPVGLLGFLLILVMTLTSNNWAVKKLGKNWKRLHKFTYAVPFLGLIHAHYAIRGINYELVLYLIPVLLLVAWRYRKYLGLAWGMAFLLGFGYLNATNIVAEVQTDDIEFYCPKAHPDSVSCGWPVYLPDGTRIDEPRSEDNN